MQLVVMVDCTSNFLTAANQPEISPCMLDNAQCTERVITCRLTITALTQLYKHQQNNKNMAMHSLKYTQEIKNCFNILKNRRKYEYYIIPPYIVGG